MSLSANENLPSIQDDLPCRERGFGLTRRQFLTRSAMTSISLSSLGFLVGCALDPVTGRQQLMMISREQEIDIDRKQSPFQFSSDYGVTQDRGVNAYVKEVGRAMLPHVHRRNMPYNFQCVNATYINAYAFPGGSIAMTRGILLKLDNEAELAGLLGHELGHVNARHMAEQASKRQITSMVLGGLAALASTQGQGMGKLTQQLGALGQGLFLSKYSRDNEREADELGHEYMVKTGYSSGGFVGLMEMLNSLNKARPSSTQILFSTHPMSSKRLSAAVQRDQGQYGYTRNFPLKRDRYMDRIASLRKHKKAINLIQEGEKYLAKESYDQAGKAFKSALNRYETDYTAHVLMAKCLLIRKQPDQALPYARTAIRLYPSEPQAHYVSGLSNMEARQFDRAYQNFKTCDQLLPGNSQLTFYKGYTQDKTGQRESAAREYIAYLKMVNYQSSKYTQYAIKRLKSWGYVN